jgi:hypothetical protein
MMNMMWAMITVGAPSGKRMFRNSASRLEPKTTSGVAIGKKVFYRGGELAGEVPDLPTYEIEV